MSDIARTCWWLLEAMSHPEFRGDPAPALKGDTTADVVIVGGGYTGMWAAWHLKQADPGLDVVLLERDECGFGPSGRNGGFINGFYDHAGELYELFGRDGALAMVDAGAQTIAELASWMTDNGVDAWFHQDGYIGVASAPRQRGGWEEPLAVARELGIDDHYEQLDKAALDRYCESPVFEGGHLVRDGGTVHPGRLARGLRRRLVEIGVRVYEHTPAEPLGPAPRVEVRTPGGTVKAGQAVVGANAWMGTWKGFGNRIVARGSYMAITAPAPERLAAINWTTGVSIYDYRSAIRYLRTTDDGRIALGVGGERGTWTGAIGPSFDFDETGTRHAVEAIHRFFPSFRDVPIEARWGGPIDVSGTHQPFVGTMPGGRIHYGVGYTGNGVGPAHLVGKILAARATGRETAETRLPIVDMEPRRWPPEPFRSVGAVITNAAIVNRDNRLDEGQGVDPVTEFLAKLPRRMGYNIGP